jgi:hypothetical protein
LPVVRPVSVSGLAVPDFDPVTPLFVETHVAVKLVIALPLLAPGVNDTVNGPVDVVVEPGAARTAVGDTGVPALSAGVAADCGPVPRWLDAATLNV